MLKIHEFSLKRNVRRFLVKRLTCVARGVYGEGRGRNSSPIDTYTIKKSHKPLQNDKILFPWIVENKETDCVGK